MDGFTISVLDFQEMTKMPKKWNLSVQDVRNKSQKMKLFKDVLIPTKISKDIFSKIMNNYLKIINKILSRIQKRILLKFKINKMINQKIIKILQKIQKQMIIKKKIQLFNQFFQLKTRNSILEKILQIILKFNKLKINNKKLTISFKKRIIVNQMNQKRDKEKFHPKVQNKVKLKKLQIFNKKISSKYQKILKNNLILENNQQSHKSRNQNKKSKRKFK